MKNKLNLFIVAIILGFSYSCSEDDEPTNNADIIALASASITVEGTTYQQAEGDPSTYVEFDFDGQTERSISITGANGSDTVDLSISFPSNSALEVATYSQESNGIDAGIRCTVNGGESFSANVLLGEDNSDYTINITSVDESLISGDFSGTLQTFNGDSTIVVSGEFVAVDLAIVLGDLLL